MQADTVWQGRVRSDYRSSEGCRCLGKSYCVGGNLESLSLGLSLVRTGVARIVIDLRRALEAGHGIAGVTAGFSAPDR
jgi:hypothetical protein